MIPAEIPSPPPGEATTIREMPRRNNRRWWLVAPLVSAVAIVIWAVLPANRAEPCTASERSGCGARCADDDGEACFLQGAALVAGDHGVALDRPAGLAAYARGCTLGVDRACSVAAGTILTEVKKGTRSPDELTDADHMLVLACDRGFGPACRLVGMEHLPPFGSLTPDTPRALTLVGRACRANDVGACRDLRKLLDAGRGDAAARAAGDAIWRDACGRALKGLACP